MWTGRGLRRRAGGVDCGLDPWTGQNSGLSASSWTGVDWLWIYPWTQAVDWLWTDLDPPMSSPRLHRAVDCGLDRGLHGHGLNLAVLTTQNWGTRVQRASSSLIRLGIYLLPHSRNAT